jgi:hypothetical protein
MNTKSINKPTQRKSKKLMLASLALSCTLAAGNASAVFGVGDTVVEVGPSLYNHIMNQINTYSQKIEDAKEYSEQAMRWKRTLDQYRQQLTQLSNFFATLKMPITLDLAEREENYGMSRRCPSADGDLSISGAISIIAPDLNGDIPGQQLRICQQTVILENRKYNELVKTVQHAKDRQKELDKLTANFTKSTDQGAVAANQAQAQALMGQTLAELQYSASKVQAYDGMVAALDEDRQDLATRAFKGENVAIGTIIKTATLAGALKVNESKK